MGVLDFLQSTDSEELEEEKDEKKEEAEPTPALDEFDKKSVEANIVKKPVISEKARDLSQQDKYVFLVDPSANKKQIADEIERRWEVTVRSVNTMKARTSPKSMVRKGGGTIEGGRKEYKKAIVTLKEGQEIDVFPV